MKTTQNGEQLADHSASMPLVKERKAKGKTLRPKEPSEEPYRSPAERRAEGKSLRDAVPRADHSGWKQHNRPNVITRCLSKRSERDGSKQSLNPRPFVTPSACDKTEQVSGSISS